MGDGPGTRRTTRTTWAAQLLARAEDTPAVVTDAATWTTADLLARVATATAWLDDLGVPDGAVVPALVSSGADAIVLVVAGALSGRPIAPIGPRLTAREVDACLDGLDCLVPGPLVADASALGLAHDVAGPRNLAATPLPSFTAGGWTGLRRAFAPDDPAVVLHTSGTSGLPKRVVLRHGPLAARTDVNGALLALGPGDRYVTAKGLHHIGGLGLVLVALAAGAAVIPYADFTPESWAALARFAPTHASVVPTMIDMLLAAGRLHLPSLRLLQYGGAPIHPATLTRLLQEEPALDVVALYGQTEGSPIAWLSPADHRAVAAGRTDLLDAAGRPAPGVELRIDAPSGDDQDGVGEVCLRAAHVLQPGPDGWLRTGDLGHVDAEGYLRLVGRKGDVIVRGGENVNPTEVERVLMAHPQVREVAVAGIPDVRLGETVGAWIVPVDPAVPPSSDDLRRFARQHLAGFKVPVRWTMCAALPRNPNGKVVRRLLPREEA